MKRSYIFASVFIMLFTGFLLWNSRADTTLLTDRQTEWHEYLGGPERNQYSELTQINPTNVNQLEVAWEYNTGVFGEMQTNPLIVNGTLYGMTANLQPFALNAATGEKYWGNSGEEMDGLSNSRGVVYWESGD
ncbi:MAG: hypothetical protein WDZ53_05645, partial [Balneolales bacterium]